MSTPINVLRNWPETISTSADPEDGMLYRMAEGLLRVTIGCMVEAGLEVPERQFVYPGAIPADCEQVAVLFNNWNTSAYGRNSIARGIMVNCNDYIWAATFSVVVVRCAPAIPGKNGKPPTAEAMRASGRIASRDAEMFTCVVNNVGQHGQTVSINTGPPSGAMQTVELDIELPYGGLVG